MKLILALFIGFFSLAAQAQIEFGAAAGLRTNQADTDVRGADVTSQMGLQLGAIAFFPINPIWGVRGGALYTQRHVDLGPTNQGDVEVRYAYFDVPVTPMIRLGDYAGIFAGPVFSFNLSKDVSCSRLSSCAALDVKSLILPLQLGIQFRIFYQLGAEFFFEYVPGELSTNISDMRTVGGNLIFYFE